MQRLAFAALAALVLAGCVSAPASPVTPSSDAFEVAKGDGSFLRVGEPCPPDVAGPHCALNPNRDTEVVAAATRHDWTRVVVNVTWPDGASYFVNVTMDSTPLGEKRSASPFSAEYTVSAPYKVLVNMWPDVGQTMQETPVHVEARFSAPSG